MTCKPEKVVLACKTFDDQVLNKFALKGQTIKIASLNVNLCKASIGFVMIDFFSNIEYENASTSQNDFNLEFMLFRKCNGVEEQLGDKWLFKRDTDGAPGGFRLKTKDTFNFRFCDFNPCCKCCTYIVKVFVEDTNNKPNVEIGQIINIGMSAIAQ